MAKFYALPELGYAFNALEPYISEVQLRLHYEKHHAAYVKGANEILEKMDKARVDGVEIDVKAALKALSFNVGGFKLHSVYWKSMVPNGGGEPSGALGEAIKAEFGSFARFKKEFSQAANSVEGSGWAALCYSKATGRLLIAQIEKHNANVYPGHRILLALDVFEHAYYLDYKNERAKFVDGFWNAANWPEAARKFEKATAP